jgi:hypothetical protein
MSTQPDLKPSLQASSNLEKRSYKRAIALICYDRKDYFERVLDSISRQSIGGASIFDQYDFYIFQDGVSDFADANQEGHSAISGIARNHQNIKQFFLQEKNLGVAKHFAFVEECLFNDLQYDFVVFCEEDMVLGDAYMASLHAMAEQFIDDERIAMVSAYSTAYTQPREKQLACLQEYLPMGHSWGYGLYRRAWNAIQPILKTYIELLGDSPYKQRNHTAIQFWLRQYGFKANATSQDYIKASAIVAMGYLRISSYPNYSLYIGERGIHFNPQSYAKHRYKDTIILDVPIAKALPIDENQYQQLWKSMAHQCLSEPNEFSSDDFKSLMRRGLPKHNFPPNLLTSTATAEDIVALYKLFFNRFPENQGQIDERLGMSMHQLLINCLNSEEFFTKHQYWPVIVSLAQKIMQKIESEKKPEGSAKTNT